MRRVVNPIQTQRKALVEFPGDNKLKGAPEVGDANFIPPMKLLFDRNNGYSFSDDKNMDRVVDYFVSKGFKVVDPNTQVEEVKKEDTKPTKKTKKRNK